MLTLVTDQNAGESDILSAVMHGAFEIRSLSGQVLKTVPAPAPGWTHEQLMVVAEKHEEIMHEGADGYLDGQWIGSSEV